MPTYQLMPRFIRDLEKLSADQRARFTKVVQEQFVPDLATGQFRPGLRVKRVQSRPGVYEMSWAPDGRATWQYGQKQRPGTAHVIWRRVGTHAVLDPGPA